MVALVAAGLIGVQGLVAPSVSAAPLASHFVQVVAHEDDDLLFMNPDVAGGITAGVATTTIYLTAGEADKGVDYVRRRQAGALAAYAQMAGLSDNDCRTEAAGPGGCWSLVERAFSGGGLVEEFTLVGRSNLQLVFLDLPETSKPVSLADLENGSAPTATTLDMDGDPNNGPWPRTYTRAGLVGFIQQLLTYYQATTVRAQDSAADPMPATDAYPLGDHGAHIAASRLADDAVTSYGAVTNARVLLEHYRDYNISAMPVNLMPEQVAEKHDTFEKYRPKDEVTGPGYDAEWGPREYSRTPRGTRWVGRDSAGLLHAFVVENGSLFEWSQDGALNWHGPYTHGNNGAALDVGLSVANNADGRLEVFARRRDTGEIVSRFQGVGGGWGWGTLGSPNAIGKPDFDSLRVSSPVVVPNGDGRLQVFVRNRGGGISTRWQARPNGEWNGWADMGGSDIQGPPEAVRTNSGRIELFAPTRGNVLHWYQPAPNAPLVVDSTFPNIVAASGLSSGVNASGRIELFFRQPESAELMTLYQAQPDGGWLGPAAIPGGPGLAEPAAATSGGRIVAMVRNRGGGVSFSRQAGPDQPFGPWTDRGGLLVGPPAAGVSRDGRIALLTLGPGGQVFLSTENADGSFAYWSLIG
ncbi:hypothetical protein [Embleya sp. AB8]|uniref:hypothetical protein n=1 Tax=Embleya sp. AB8 TaxID=3156304 RepID=UPI003C710B32